MSAVTRAQRGNHGLATSSEAASTSSQEFWSAMGWSSTYGAAGNMLLCEPLDGAGKHVSGTRGCDLARSVTCPALSPATCFPVCRVRRAARKVRCRSMSPTARTDCASEWPSRAAGRVLRGAPVSAVTHARRGKTGSQRDCRATHGVARVAEAMWRARFSTASNGAPAQNGPCGARQRTQRSQLGAPN